MRKSIGSYVALVAIVLCVMLTASAVAQQNWYPSKYASADSGVYRWLTVNNGLVAKGGVGMRVTYTGATIGAAVIPQWSLVGWDSTPIVVVTRALIGDTLNQRMTVADSLHSTVLDTLPSHGASTTQYDTSKIASFRLRIRVTAADATNDTVGVIVRGKDAGGISQRITFKFKQTGTLDTTLLQSFSHVDSIWATGKAAGDSVAVWAYVNGPGVVTGTGYATATNPESYAGIAQTPMTSRTRGIVNWEGPSKVLINGTTSSVRPSYWLLPSGVAGQCSTAQDKPDLAIGKVWDRGNISGTYDAWLHADAGSATGIGIDAAARADADTAQVAADSGIAAADSALAVADSGVAAADSALAAADSALAAADSALTAADSGVAAADSALTVADSALTTADSALAAADSALAAAIAAGTYVPSMAKVDFRAGQFIVPATGGPALLQSDSTNASWFSLAYDGTTAEKAYVFTAMQGYYATDHADSGVVRIFWTADTAGLDTVHWTVDIGLRADGQLLDSTLDFGGYMTDVNTGQGMLNVCSAPFTFTGAAANQLVDIAIGRDPTVDNMTQDAEIVLVELDYYTSGADFEPQ